MTRTETYYDPERPGVHELSFAELEAISGGVKGTSETVGGSGSGTVSGTAAGGSDRHSGYDCHY